ncbi:Gfo/Idh/MocA family protein [Bombilactobacillus thymidiniphilus]|uniref:Gfo/Idh/MocA family oxidoreductase n=1 Tax=Bombilactobacillus thymidiniphilus TaxID=2923363 RepID=A0ABY4PCA2_9LACO|nr:Gfo/Idh/MocA family oxidoreductase [Bombilactobacillus thymidiniphilus]UQS83245.1 Gfo/Idh/MocA family oxidoreductase [Bombilactobacillus thymidiniphilus]
MLKLGVIGTNWITKQFVEAVQETATFQLTTIYSRTMEHALEFKEQLANGSYQLETNLEHFLSSTEVDVVYVASPNSLHFAQVKQAILHGKHVIVEKPLVSTRTEFLALQELLAQHPKVYVFEAARHIHEPEFKFLQASVAALPKIDGATITYRKYSSRYDQVLAGQTPNIFSPVFSGGALYDLGVYLLYDALCLFGMPEKSEYMPQMLPTKVDGQGTIILHYPTFDVTLLVGKISNSFLPSEIYSGSKTILFDDGGTVRKLWNNEVTTPIVFPEHNPMLAEAQVFSQILQKQDRGAFNKLWSLADQVNQLLTTLRTTAGIEFAADSEMRNQ